jgi:hypothetical protein
VFHNLSQKCAELLRPEHVRKLSHAAFIVASEMGECADELDHHLAKTRSPQQSS